ncbi:hypothetical protein RRG08_014802 [Elysia crispata]|uniref:Uncharacterized protein n=1 Tax=Elysia crispata TaxID=231223 RepID=A0AAE1D9T1_9GAST|nr:hypothetical protein RRG08_014802 [Elysia crispata]
MDTKIKAFLQKTKTLRTQQRSGKKSEIMNLKMAKKILVVLAIILLSSNETAVGAPPPTPTIDNPCMAVKVLFQQFPPLLTQFKATGEESYRVSSAAVTLTKALERHGFLTPDDLLMLKALDVRLPGLPLAVQAVDKANQRNIVEFFRQAYHDISIHIEYVQMALSEQVAIDNRLLEQELSELEKKLFHLLCKVHTILKSQGEVLTSFVDASVIPDGIKDIQDTTMRYMRNYILGQDITIFMDNLIANCTSFYKNGTLDKI